MVAAGGGSVAAAALCVISNQGISVWASPDLRLDLLRLLQFPPKEETLGGECVWLN